MRILLDDHPCELEARSISEAIAGAAALAEARGRIVVEVSVDGAAWSGADLAATDLDTRGAAEIALVSADLVDVVGETLGDASGALTEADALQREAATLVQSGRVAEAMERLEAAIDIWLKVHDAVTKCTQALSLDLEELPVGEGSLETAVATLKQHLETVHGAVESGDLVGLADTLLYDLPDVVLTWREALLALRTRVGADAPPSSATGEES